MLSKCFKCDFNVRNSDEFCLNCGLYEPLKLRKKAKADESQLLKLTYSYSFRILLAIIMTIVTFLLSHIFAYGFDLSKLFQKHLIFYLVCIIPAFLNAFFCSHLARRYLSKTKPLQKVFGFPKESLNGRQQLISQRLYELNRREREIHKVLFRIDVNEGTQLNQLSFNLKSVSEMVGIQRSRYQLQEFKIDLVRLQNRILPFVENVEYLDRCDSETGILSIEQAIHKLISIDHELTRDFPFQIEPEKQHFVEQLKETKNVCEKLREVLLSKQAIRALKDISPLEELNMLPQTVDLSHATETFNIEATLTDFSDSFDQLESEYQRIIDESEISQKLINF